MAQRTEKEADVPETLTPCINNNMSISTNNNRFANDPISSSSSISEPDSFGIEARTTSQEGMTKRESFIERKRTTETESEMKPAATNRCSGCRKKVGLTGFRCRCGDVFCSVHRYSDRHACSYDYKAAGKAAIARENPIVKSAQIVRI